MRHALRVRRGCGKSERANSSKSGECSHAGPPAAGRHVNSIGLSGANFKDIIASGDVN